MHTVSPAKDVLAKLKVSSEVVSKESLQCRGHWPFGSSLSCSQALAGPFCALQLGLSWAKARPRCRGLNTF